MYYFKQLNILNIPFFFVLLISILWFYPLSLESLLHDLHWTVILHFALGCKAKAVFSWAVEEPPQNPTGTLTVESDEVGVGFSQLAFIRAVHFMALNSSSNHFLKISATSLIRGEEQQRTCNYKKKIMWLIQYVVSLLSQRVHSALGLGHSSVSFKGNHY